MFWQTFSELCNKSGIKPNPLGKILGISSGSLTNWKNGSLPNGETLLQIADYFHVSVDYLLGRDVQSNEPISTSVTINRKGIKSVYSVSDDTADIVEGILKKLSN